MEASPTGLASLSVLPPYVMVLENRNSHYRNGHYDLFSHFFPIMFVYVPFSSYLRSGKGNIVTRIHHIGT